MGHSACARFVHRYITSTGASKVKRFVAANTGWHTLPLLGEEFPYGFAGSPADKENLKALFGKDLFILLEGQDKLQSKILQQTREAMEQGPHQLPRGKWCYTTGVRIAPECRLPFH